MKTFSLSFNPSRFNEKLISLFFVAVYLFAGAHVLAQRAVSNPVTNPTPPPKPFPKPIPKTGETGRIAKNESDIPAEKSIAVEAKVNVSFCVMQGNIRIYGWDRNEVRALVKEGSQVGFKVAEKHPQTEKPVWIFVLGFDPQKTTSSKPEECLSGNEIELDVPRGAIINLKSRQSEIKIESVRKVRVENLSGDIFLNDITEGISATTFGGNIAVENSGGEMMLNSMSGNIVAFSARQSEFGESFKAKTNSGTITLEAVEHRQIETNTLTGATIFRGKIASGGQYGFGTQTGAIFLTLPENSVCKVNAWYSFGAFNSDIALQNIVQKNQSLTAQLGTGETNCTINLRTFNGAIRIKKQ